MCYVSLKRPRKMCNCMVLDVTAIFFWITAFLKKLPFLAKGHVVLMFLLSTSMICRFILTKILCTCV